MHICLHKRFVTSVCGRITSYKVLRFDPIDCRCVEVCLEGLPFIATWSYILVGVIASWMMSHTTVYHCLVMLSLMSRAFYSMEVVLIEW